MTAFSKTILGKILAPVGNAIGLAVGVPMAGSMLDAVGDGAQGLIDGKNAKKNVADQASMTAAANAVQLNSDLVSAQVSGVSIIGAPLSGIMTFIQNNLLLILGGGIVLFLLLRKKRR
jgi:hypothetical protein